jgi:hypothetical protein
MRKLDGIFPLYRPVVHSAEFAGDTTQLLPFQRTPYRTRRLPVVCASRHLHRELLILVQIYPRVSTWGTQKSPQAPC